MLRLEESDHLGVDYVSEKDVFLLKPRSLTANILHRMVGSTERYQIDGVEYYDHFSGKVSGEGIEFFKTLTEGAWSKKHDSVYVAPAVDSIAVMVYREWSARKLVFVNETAKTHFYKLLNEFASGEKVAVQAAEFKTKGIVPPLPAFWQERADAKLSPYQRTAVQLSLQTDAMALHMDRGTGKTACAIQRINMLALALSRGQITGGAPQKDGSRMLRVLVIVPKNVRLNWQREFEKFSHVPGRVLALRGGLHQRVRRIAEIARAEPGCMYSVLITSYDGARTTRDYLTMIPWDDVICDEAHYFKDPNTQRFKDLVIVRDIASARRLELTGSPIGNSPMDLWSQLEFLRKGGSGFTSRKAFRSFYGEYDKPHPGVQGVAKLIGLKNVPLLQERLARMTFSVTKEEAGLNLPDKVRSVIEVEMTAYQADVYARLQDELALEVEDKLSGEIVDEVTVQNILTRMLRLAQVTSGHITYDAKIDMDNGEVIVPKRIAELSSVNPKVEALLEFLQDEERPAQAKTIVWCQFIHNITLVKEALDAAGIKSVVYYGAKTTEERDAAVDAFNNDPDCKVIVCNPQTAGEGLNLLGYNLGDPANSDTYCDAEIFFSIGWSAILRSQAEDRAHRRGTRMPVQIIDLVVPGSIDEDILARITHKRESAEAIVDLRETLNRILSRKVEAA